MIEAKALCKRFGSIGAAREVSFVARDGEITGLLGPNGAGKSTTLRMLYGVLTPDSGSACIDGIDIRGETSSARAHLGVLPHAAGLYANLTARENIEYFGSLQGMGRDRLRDPHSRTGALARHAELHRTPRQGILAGPAHQGGAGARAGARPGKSGARRADQRPRRDGDPQPARHAARI